MGLLLRTRSGSFLSGQGRGLRGLVLLESRDVERRRGPAAPLLQLAVLEEEVAGWQGNPRLRLGLAERVGDAAVQVRGLDAILPRRGHLSVVKGRQDGMRNTISFFLPGMTERSSAPSGTVCGSNGGALAG